MNKRIKELWDKAALLEPDPSWEGQTRFMEKFAELIVKECVDVCNQVASNAHKQKQSSFLTEDGKQLYNGVWGGAMNCAGGIENHFGVK